jgi:hypothetical protein
MFNINITVFHIVIGLTITIILIILPCILLSFYLTTKNQIKKVCGLCKLWGTSECPYNNDNGIKPYYNKEICLRYTDQ